MKIPADVYLQKQLTDIHVQDWLKDDLFQPRWWILIAIMLIVIVVWCLLVKKTRLLEVSLYLALAAILFMGVNEYGEELALWDYPTDIIPVFPPLSSINMFLLPFTFSLVYQYYTSRKSFLIATLVTTCVICFIIDPVLSAGRLYELINWKFYESIPVYYLTAAAVRAIIVRIYNKIEKHQVKLKQSM